MTWEGVLSDRKLVTAKKMPLTIFFQCSPTPTGTAQLTHRAQARTGKWYLLVVPRGDSRTPGRELQWLGEGGTGVWKEVSCDLAEGEVSQELCIPTALLAAIPIMSVHLTATLGL